MYKVYILRLEGGGYYVGCTSLSLKQRLYKHFCRSNPCKRTKEHKPRELVGLAYYGESENAFREEKELRKIYKYKEYVERGYSPKQAESFV